MDLSQVKFIETTRQAFQSKPFQIFLIIVIVLVAIYLVGKKMGEDAAKGKLLEAKPLPNSGNGIPKGWADNTQTVTDANGNTVTLPKAQSDLQAIVEEQHNVLQGLGTLSGTKEKSWERLNALTADQLTAVYNEYNRLYQGEGGSLYRQILDEWNPPRWVSESKDNILKRFELLNLK